MSRLLIDHMVPGDTNNKLVIAVVDEPGAGGAHHRYEITGLNTDTNKSSSPEDLQTKTVILFQNGPIPENGVNGITIEALIAIAIDRLSSFQQGPFACFENASALLSLRDALHSLNSRTVERIRRNVEGKNIV